MPEVLHHCSHCGRRHLRAAQEPGDGCDPTLPEPVDSPLATYLEEVRPRMDEAEATQFGNIAHPRSHAQRAKSIIEA